MRGVSKDSGKDIKIAVHYTNIENNTEVYDRAKDLQNAKVDYDVFGLSFIFSGMELWRICSVLQRISKITMEKMS